MLVAGFHEGYEWQNYEPPYSFMVWQQAGQANQHTRYSAFLLEELTLQPPLSGESESGTQATYKSMLLVQILRDAWQFRLQVVSQACGGYSIPQPRGRNFYLQWPDQVQSRERTVAWKGEIILVLLAVLIKWSLPGYSFSSSCLVLPVCLLCSFFLTCGKLGWDCHLKRQQ